MYTPVNPSFTIYKWGVRGCTLNGHVSMMLRFNCVTYVVTFKRVFEHYVKIRFQNLSNLSICVNATMFSLRDEREYPKTTLFEIISLFIPIAVSQPP